MAVNQVSLFFYPPRWQQLLRTDTAAITWEGTPVQIAYASPTGGTEAPPLLPSDVRQWLAEQGFVPVEWNPDGTFQRGQVRSMFGPEKEIEVCLGVEAGEVAQLYCRFTLPRRTPPQLPGWARFVARMCDRFTLRLGTEGIAPCGEAEFIEAVRAHRNYQEFADSFGWEGGT